MILVSMLLVFASLWLATYSARHVKPIWVHQVLTSVCLVSIIINLIWLVLSIIEL
jgi:hypothetical protein